MYNNDNDNCIYLICMNAHIFIYNVEFYVIDIDMDDLPIDY